MEAYIVADSREDAVYGFIAPAAEEAGVLVVRKAITVGDYLVCNVAGGRVNVLACVERKSLKDFGASIKDGRYRNVQKMEELRAATGAQLIYVVEGPAHPRPERKFAGIPYRTIRSATLSLVVKHGVCVLTSPDERETARLLCDLAKKYTERALSAGAGGGEEAEEAEGSEEAEGAGGTERTEVEEAAAPAGAPAGAVEAGGEGAAVSGVSRIPDAAAGEAAAPGQAPDLSAFGRRSARDRGVDLWCALPGVSLVTAGALVQSFSPLELLRGAADLEALRLASGRAPGRRALATLRSLLPGSRSRVRREAAARALLRGVPGVGRQTAEQLLPGGGDGVAALLALCDGGAGPVTIARGGKPVAAAALVARIREALAYRAAE